MHIWSGGPTVGKHVLIPAVSWQMLVGSEVHSASGLIMLTIVKKSCGLKFVTIIKQAC